MTEKEDLTSRLEEVSQTKSDKFKATADNAYLIRQSQ